MSATATVSDEFVITRVLDAPRERVWQAWTEKERLAQWWGPKGCVIRVVKFDLRLGGHFHYVMQFPGSEMWGRFTFREISPPGRLVFVNSFSNEAGEVTRAPFPGIGETIPLEIQNTVTFVAQGNQTRMTLRAVPLNASDIERQTFIGMMDSLNQGCGGTFDQLEAHLALATGDAP